MPLPRYSRRSMLRRVASLVVLSLALLPGGAMAQSSPEPGVHVDPNSPSGKEYAIPLDDARGKATPKPAKTKAATTNPSTSTAPAQPAPTTTEEATPLFGAGIEPDKGSDTKSSNKTKTTQADDEPAADDSSDDTSDQDDQAAALAAAIKGDGGDSGGGGSVAGPVGVGIAVLLLGGGLGYFVRRRNLASQGRMRPGSSEL